MMDDLNVWIENYEVPQAYTFEDPLIYFAIVSDCDPTTIEKVVKELKWQNVMDEKF